jgi:hypothetical protein
MVIGRVLALYQGSELPRPLVFFRGRYAVLADTVGGPAPELSALTGGILGEYW